MDNIQSINFFIPELILVATIAFCLIIDFFLSKKNSFNVAYVALIGIILSGISLWFSSPLITTSLFLNSIVLDPFSRIFKFIFLISSFITILISLDTSELKNRSLGEYFTLITAMILGLILMTSSVDLIMIYLSIELVSIISFILAGYLRFKMISNEAAIKYVIYGAFSSGLMLYGFSLLYGLTGTTKLFEMNKVLFSHDFSHINLSLIVSFLLIIAGLGYKIAIAPFHFWTPDVYEGSPTPITAFFSVAPKAAGFALMVRFLNSLFGDVNPLNSENWVSIEGVPWQAILLLLSALTMIIGNLIAIQQENVKRLLAYSSIAHAGYILMGIPLLSKDGVFAVVFYIIVYLFMQLGAFYISIIIADKYKTEKIEDYAGIGWQSPFLGILMSLFMFSLTGLPPTAGFIGKFYLFAAVINAGTQYYWIAIIGVLNSVISLYYYMRIVKVMYFNEKNIQNSFVPSQFSILLLLILGIPTIYFGVQWTYIHEWVDSALKFFIPNF